jgi:uncharacterized membrane protein
MRSISRHVANSIAAGLLAVLPLVITVAIIAWVASFVRQLTGPDSLIGGILSAVGLFVVSDELTAYLVGTLVVLFALYFIGRLVASRVSGQAGLLLDRVINRVPLIGSIYGLTNRFVGMLDRREDTDLKSMSPDWCFFGGEASAAVLALMPTTEPIEIAGRRYRVVLVPTAPIPIGGGLIFVPAEWVVPAGFGVEGFTSIYVTMGVTAPQFAPPQGAQVDPPHAKATGG